MDLCIWNFESAKAFVYGAPFLLLLCALQYCIHAEVMCLQIIYWRTIDMKIVHS